MESMETIEAFTVIGFGSVAILFTLGELVVTWLRELRIVREQRRPQ